jgi:hypothetical protein
MVLYWIFGILLTLTILFFLTTFICFMMVFYVKKKKPLKDGEFAFPKEKVYRPYRDRLQAWMKKARELPHEDLEITSYDGLKLRGKYYEKDPNAPIELMLHGYKSNHEADLSGGVFRALDAGHNVLLFDHRASGRSDGSVITFGILESRDCIAWVDYILKNIIFIFTK